MYVKKNLIKVIILLIVLFFSARTTYAALTKSFGGKVKLTTIPNVICEGSGTIFVLSSNLVGTAQEMAGASGSNTEKTIKKVSTAMKAVNDTMPFYSTDSEKNPKVGDMILGKANTIPDFSICKLQIGPYRIPFPVKKTTDNYNVSRKSDITGSNCEVGGDSYNAINRC